jgi:Fe-S cluster biogenesis protein NfuA
MTPLRQQIGQQINDVIAKVRATLCLDGGDVRLVDVKDDGEVTVGLSGNCAGCPLSRHIIRLTLDRWLGGLPGVRRVTTVDEPAGGREPIS